MFTSGSTGEPKGVVISHRSVISMVEQFTAVFEFQEGSVFGNQAPFDFDVSIKDVYLALRAHGTLEFLEKQLFSFPRLLLEHLRERHVDVAIWAVPALKVLAELDAYPERMYRTGDLACRRNGLLYYMGRKNTQIKHTGHRIEMAEIELCAPADYTTDEQLLAYLDARRLTAHRKEVVMPKEKEIKKQIAPPGEPVCAICGKPILSGCTIDHVVPQAVYKWHECYLDKAEFNDLRRRITSPRNTVKTHRYCNERKEEAIIRVDGLHVSRTKRAKLRATFAAVEPYIEAFLKRKAELSDQQQGRCYICHAPLKKGVLRRIDDEQPRTWDNACIICHRCNCKVKSKDVKTYRRQRNAARRRARRARAAQKAGS